MFRRTRALWGRFREWREERRTVAYWRDRCKNAEDAANDLAGDLDDSEKAVEDKDRRIGELEHERDEQRETERINTMVINRLTDENEMARQQIQAWTATFSKQIASLDKDHPDVNSGIGG
jgi:chromosome segregation ATPase